MKKVYVSMSGDIIHHGHIRVIEKAREYGEVTIGLLTDKAITEYKRLPHLRFEQRRQVLENVRGVSQVLPQQDWDDSIMVRELKPDYVVHGDDWKQAPMDIFRNRVLEALSEWGGELVEVPYTRDISSSDIVKNISGTGITPTMRLQSLKRLIAAKDIVRVIESHNGLSGLIAENASVERDGKIVCFDGMWSSSLTDSTSRGKPDIEAVDVTSRLVTINDIFEVTTKPMIYDGDTGGKLEHFPFTVRTLERVGISAVIVEDKTGLKKNSLLGNEVSQKQDSIEGFCTKIQAGLKARINPEFMIVTRIESLILDAGMDDAIARAEAYIGAGADAVMIHSRHKNPAEVYEFCARFHRLSKTVPLIVVPTSYDEVYEHELIDHGINVCIYANHMLRSAYPAMWDVAHKILKHGRACEVREQCLSIKDILKLVPGTI
ncbi:phosphoenolpyruvate mutase [Candidatus Haliotispira prima]|uniref:phosphoenolpyruvate mutase n=1 Tax=Candidatus Haliotispira prima TaxID=3034016 RepID=A0ABY8MFE4_9SPIO|nr:phosphoenolpyruvate mutase [Candidatus Haliotispira prima]